MYYKEDWPRAKQQLASFWAREYTGRALAGILAPRKSSRVDRFPHLTNGPWLGGLEKFRDDDRESIQKWWTDPEENYTRMKFWMENTAFVGEAVPATYINWGASAACAFWGAPPEFNKTSVWFPKVIENWNNWEWTFNMETDPWLHTVLDILQVFIDRNREDYFIGVPEIGNAADNLSLMRSASDLAMDLVLHPEAVKQAVDVMSDAWVKIENLFFERTRDANQGGGVLAWLNLWAPGQHDQIANDFSSMLSPEMFKDFFFPELRKMGSALDYTTFHLDGQQCIMNHVDILLEIDEIDCIQFTPGAGAPPTSHPGYLPVFRKIQEAGKRLYLLVEPREIETILEHLSARGLYLNSWAESEETAENMIKHIAKWSVDRG